MEAEEIMPNSPLITAAIKYRYRLDAASARDLQRLIDAYQNLAGRLKDKIDLLIAELSANPEITGGQVVRMARYRDLIRAISDELSRYGIYLETELGGISNAALSQAILDYRALLRQSGLARVESLPAASIKTALGFLAPDSPLYQHIEELAPTTAQYVADRIVEGVGLGYNPAKVGRMIVDDLGQGLSSALRLARTTQMWTYRETSRATMAANANVVDGWVWFAILDGDIPPCESCLANHGKLFPLEETLDDHYNGRCVAIPHVVGDDNPVDQSGEDWFGSLPEATQRDIMGAGKLAAYNDGEITFDQLTRQVQDPVFGSMRTGVPLKDLVK